MQPKLYAVLADIHANFQALQAVVQDATSVAREGKAESLHFIVLGDVVDYGPQPNECMAWVTQHAEIVVQGNHDSDVAYSVYQPPKTITTEYWPITIWTRMVLQRPYKIAIQSWLPKMCTRNHTIPGDLKEFKLFHSSLTSGHQYIDNPRAAWDNLQLLRDGIKYGLFGHSHIQGYFVDDPLKKRHHNDKKTMMIVTSPEESILDTLNGSNLWVPEVLKPNMEHKGVGCTVWKDLPAQPTLFNPGAVGQSRSHGTTKILASSDNRAAYMLLKLNGHMEFQFRRVPYDVEETIRRLREDVVWPIPPYVDKQGSDILKEVEPNPFPREAWEQLMREYRQAVNTMGTTLPRLVEDVLIPQLM